MTDNIFGDDFDLDPNFDQKPSNGSQGSDKSKQNATNELKDLDEDTKDNFVEDPFAEIESDHSDVRTVDYDDAADLDAGLDWNSDPFQEDSDKSTIDDAVINKNFPELNSLLDEYGIESEIAKTSVDDRLAKMQSRVDKQTPTSKEIAQKKSAFSGVLWAIGCLFLVGLLVVQYSIFNITTLVKSPDHREKLVTACEVLSCHLPNADIKAIKISHVKHRASKIKTPDNNVDVMGALINASDQSQLYPNLKVTIYGDAGKIGEFIAPPKKYMKIEQDQLMGSQARLFMFTIAMKNQNIKDIEIKPFY